LQPGARGSALVYPEDSMAGRILAGREEALGELSRWIAQILSLPQFWRLRPDWLDLHQEVIARVLESLRRGRYDPAHDLHAYVQGVGRYVAFEALRRKNAGSETRWDESLAGNPAPDPAQLVIDKQLARRALECAPPPCRELIRAYFFEQRDYASIAASSGLAIGTVKSRLFRCLEAVHLAITGRLRSGGEPGASGLDLVVEADRIRKPGKRRRQ